MFTMLFNHCMAQGSLSRGGTSLRHFGGAGFFPLQLSLIDQAPEFRRRPRLSPHSVPGHTN